MHVSTRDHVRSIHGVRPENGQPQESLLYLNGSTVFLYAGLRIASKMKASVLTSRMEQ